MGRHGGGSRGGGSSRSGGGSSRRSGGSGGARISRTAFAGSYNRSYYDRSGKYHPCFTSDRNFGKKSGWSVGVIAMLCFITFHMLMMLSGLATEIIQTGNKISGDKSRIVIEDAADILTSSEEQRIIELFNEVYDNSGMPITLVTDDFSWRDYYDSIQIYSEELYYAIDMREDAALFLFTCDNEDGFWDWEYDIYCGDDTEECFSDSEFDDVLSNFHKAMAKDDLTYALEYSWDSVMDKIGRTDFNFSFLPVILILILFYGIFYFAILFGVRKQNTAYRYFKENPDMLSDTYAQSPQKAPEYYSECPNCGAPNKENGRICAYCGSVLEKTADNASQNANS